uniref:G-protein coupled receptors family 2 profile 2 domain-containing protein n=1 Tax=Amphimedon queenslandica TaxID=400682 RepID=A0A1X7TB06_AMPQE
MLYLNGRLKRGGMCINASTIDHRVSGTLPYTLTSSSLSVIGSLLIIVSFLALKDARSSNVRKLIFLLAVADLFTAASFIAAVVRRYTFMSGHDVDQNVSRSSTMREDSSYLTFCKAQAAFTAYFQCVALFLTAFLAVYFFIILVRNNHRLARKLMLPFCLMSWGVPIIICGYVFANDKFGIGDSRSSVGWCFIDNIFILSSSPTSYKNKVIMYFLWELLAQKLWEICKCRKKIKTDLKKQEVVPKETDSLVDSDDEGQWTSHKLLNAKSSTRAQGMKKVEKAISKTDWRLALVPLIFLLFRFWGNLRYFITMRNDCHLFVDENYFDGYFCISETCFNLLYNKGILILHAFGDPAQGFGNSILFVFLSRNIMRRLIAPVLKILAPLNCRKKTEVIEVNSNRTELRKDSKPAKARIVLTYSHKIFMMTPGLAAAEDDAEDPDED